MASKGEQELPGALRDRSRKESKPQQAAQCYPIGCSMSIGMGQLSDPDLTFESRRVPMSAVYVAIGHFSTVESG